MDAAAFVIGNVAPGSGRPNHDWTRFDPPKTVTHLLRPGEDEGCIPDLTFWRDHVQGQRDLTPADSAFVLGCFTHLVSDNLWMHFIGRPTKETFDAEFAHDQAGTWGRVKDDWYGLDHKYLRGHPVNVFARHMVSARNPCSLLPFLDSEALAHRLDDLREFSSHPGSFVQDRSYPYLSEASMNRVVEDYAQVILTLVSRLKAEAIPADHARTGPAGPLRLALNGVVQASGGTPVPSNTGHVHGRVRI